MSFTPEFGVYSRDEFKSSLGATFTDSSKQAITGGVVTLVSNLSGSSSVIQIWNDINNWSFSDNLYTYNLVTGVFQVLTGQCANQINSVSGSQGLIGESRAWAVSTSYPLYTGLYTGAGPFGLALGDVSTNQQLVDFFFSEGGRDLTLEFDVQINSSYSGLPLPGFFATGNNLTALPALTGIVGHGVLISNGTTWDFFETTEFGIRSLNHPELAIPIDLTSPKRIRIGVRGNDTFITTEDGKSTIGYSKLDTEVGNAPDTPLIVFGAPTNQLPYCYSNAILTGIDGSVGDSLWDNIKFITGQMSIYGFTGTDQRYSTSSVTMYTDEFNPSISVNKYLYATIGYLPYNGGDTTVSAQYSGVTGWTTYSSTTLPHTGHAVRLDLTNLPIYLYPRTDGGIDYLDNPVRFKVDQYSYSGNGLPPALDYIEIFLDKEISILDILPNWKPASTDVTVRFGVETGSFITADPSPQIWSRFLFNTPATTGVMVGTTFTGEAKNLPIKVVGTGEINKDGPFGYSFKNYSAHFLSAITGSAAFDYFGSTPQSNLFLNPLFAEPFREIVTGEANFYSGLTNGYIASNCVINRSFTGDQKLDFSSLEVYRPENQAETNRINSYLGHTLSDQDEYVQHLYVYSSSSAHNGTAGLEAIIPSGIATGKLLIYVDLEVVQGTGAQLTISGSSISRFFVPYQLGFQTITVPFTQDSASTLAIGISVPSGAASTAYEYNIDNILVIPYSDCYLTGNYITGYLHQTGIPEDYFSASDTKKNINRAATVLHGNIYLDSYPISNSGIFVSLLGSDSKGLELNIDSNGYLNAIFSQYSNAWTGLEALPVTKVSSNTRVPLSKWSHIGFLHDVNCYDKFSYASISGEGRVHNFTSSNRVILTIDGYPVANQDLMTGWQSHHTYSGDAAPYLSYIALSGNVTAKVASGLLCKVDGVHLLTPPVADAETELSLLGARVTAPYFVPDSLYADGNYDSNLGYAGPSDPSIGKDFYLGSFYNFSSPGYTHWDRGPLNNHLLFYGTISKELNSPYTGTNLYSTRFISGYAIAPYSSSLERIVAPTGQLLLTGASTLDGLNNGGLTIFGWLYPYSTGTFFTYYESTTATANRIEFTINQSNYLVINKYDNSNTVVYTSTGHQAELEDWSFINTRIYQSGYTTGGSTSDICISIADETALTSSLVTGNGVDFGIKYQGRTGTSPSSFKFGGTADVSFFNWVINPLYSGDLNYLHTYSTDASKSGSYQKLLLDSTPYTGVVSFTGYNGGVLPLGATTGASLDYYSVALLDSYNNSPPYNGIVCHNRFPFTVIDTYNLKYDTSAVTNVYGSNDSPIRFGSQVPENGINIAKYSIPAATVPASISTVDLSSRNENNLVTYRDGNYSVSHPYGVGYSSLTGYNNINLAQYSGRSDWIISGQVISADVDVSTYSICDQNLNTSYDAYYYYLVGRGTKGVKIIDAYPHYTGDLLTTSTGTVTNNYISNIELIKNSIQLKDSKGNVLDFDTFPYSIITSAYTPDSLLTAINSGLSVGLDNIGTYQDSLILDDTVFSIILLTNKNRIDGTTVFVHYPGVNLSTNEYLPSAKEIVNPQPIYRERHVTEAPGFGKFDLTLGSLGYYDIKIYGIDGSYSGKL